MGSNPTRSICDFPITIIIKYASSFELADELVRTETQARTLAMTVNERPTAEAVDAYVTWTKIEPVNCYAI